MTPQYPRLLPNSENPLPNADWWDRSDEGELQFAYWVPNVSGGLVVTSMPMETGWDVQSNVRYGQIAEENGFSLALAQTRWFASYGADHQHEAFVISSQILAHTEKLHLITAVHPGLWHPGVVAKMQASLDGVSNGRTAINVVSGWFKDEFTGFGLPWLDHAERYRRSEEFIRVLKGMWSEDEFSFFGSFYALDEAPMRPKPVHRIPIFQGGNSKDARQMFGRVSDIQFMNGNTDEGFLDIINDGKAAAEESGRDPNELKFGANGFVIVRDTEEEAAEVLRQIIEQARTEEVKGFAEANREAGASSAEGEGMWANSSLEDMVQYNDGFKTGLIGTAEQVADRILELKDLGIDIILTSFLNYDWEIEDFGKKVIPLVREKEEAREKTGSRSTVSS